MSAVLNIGPLKWKLTALLYLAVLALKKGLFQHLSGSFCVQLNEFLKKNVWCVNFIQLTLALSLIRDGLQLTDISGAAYSQWCKEKQPPNFTVFILRVVCLVFFPSDQQAREKQEIGARLTCTRRCSRWHQMRELLPQRRLVQLQKRWETCWQRTNYPHYSNPGLTQG